MKKLTLITLAIGLVACSMNDDCSVECVTRTCTDSVNIHYTGNKKPLLPLHFLKLPVGSIQPKGWIEACLLRQRDGLTGHLGEISAWLQKDNNAWLDGQGNGQFGWEEVPYWLKGYANLGYILKDTAMVAEAKIWLNAALNSQRTDGSFGPKIEKNGKPDLWGNMIMLWCLHSYYEFSKDQKVLTFMSNYFRWQLTVPDEAFLEDFWENSRGGDNLYSVFWLYNITGEKWLLQLAEKIHANTANWSQNSTLPNWHNVNIAQCFREPATWWMLSADSADLKATYNNFHLIRRTFGQVPGGMFGGDENSRMGYIDPRQGVETCGIVEQMASDQLLLRFTGDPTWADHCENVAFNSFPATMMPDLKALRYITAPNSVVADSENHHPGIDNKGPFLLMNPFSSRCCQHNHTQGWPYYAEHLWMATPDNGLAAVMFNSCNVTAKVNNNTQVTINETTTYPFDEKIQMTIHTPENVEFPLYVRIPAWCDKGSISINGRKINTHLKAGTYARIARRWHDNDQLTVMLPMALSVQQWDVNQHSISVNYGPLTFSLKIKEGYQQCSSKATAIEDSHWQQDADERLWPAWKIYADSEWNYALHCDDVQHPEKSFKVIKKSWTRDNFPFTQENAPIEIQAMGSSVPEWSVDQTGLCGILPNYPALTTGLPQKITLIPMGAARLRITAFPPFVD